MSREWQERLDFNANDARDPRNRPPGVEPAPWVPSGAELDGIVAAMRSGLHRSRRAPSSPGARQGGRQQRSERAAGGFLERMVDKAAGRLARELSPEARAEGSRPDGSRVTLAEKRAILDHFAPPGGWSKVRRPDGIEASAMPWQAGPFGW